MATISGNHPFDLDVVFTISKLNVA